MNRLGRAIASLTIIVFTLVSLPATAAIPALKPEMIYFVMLDRFANGDSSDDEGGLTGGPSATGLLPSDPGFYHGGDLRGLIDHIPYIKSLGFTAIWVTPVVRQLPVASDGKSSAYHGYWGVGFDQVDPHLGTMADFKEFVSDAHAEQMKVILDVVVNHTADVIHYQQGGSYVAIADQPYKTSNGKSFDPVVTADTSAFPGLDQLSATTSFPKMPIIDTPNVSIKSPDWLNDPKNYHNRGNVGQSEESMQYGDFYGLDDLFTESPAVLAGWINVFSHWVTDTGLDGFRIDTARHVNKEFWNAFLPAMRKTAFTQGKKSFPMWGEIYDTDPRNTSFWIKQASYNEVLDFPMQPVMVNFVNTQDASLLGTYFNNDDFYTTATTNANGLGTFLGNHDMGRVGSFIVARTDDATVALKRDELAHVLLFTIRGIPMVYYGDEYGLTGGSDKEARQDLFPTAVESWQDQFRIGSAPIGLKSSFETSNPLQELIRTLTSLRTKFPALATGSQRTDYADNGIFVFSRFDPVTHREVLVALNSTSQKANASFASNTPASSWNLQAGDGVATSASLQTSVNLPPLSWAVFTPSGTIAKASSLSTSITTLMPDPFDSDQIEIDATATGSPFVDVKFMYRVGSGQWKNLGIDSAPTFSFNPKQNGLYRIFPLVRSFPKKSLIQFKTVVTDSFGVSATSAFKTLRTK